MKLETMTFEEIYLIFYNNYLTIERMAEDYQVNTDLLKHWIDCGRTDNHKEWEDKWAEFQAEIDELYIALSQ
jgi:hypothetical protein